MIWTAKLTFDARDRWDAGGFSDARVVHLWAQQDVLGNWFSQHLSNYQGSTWDTYLLFDAKATWAAQPPPLLSSGATVIDTKDMLAQSIQPLLQ